MAVTPSLSVVLPAYNSQATITDSIERLLEILPELTSVFEILVIDDGSSDNTEDVALETAREFPQVRVAKHQIRRGHAGIVETGLARTSGDIMFVHDENAPIDSTKIRQLWEFRNDEDVVLARPDFRVKRSLLQRLATWGIRLDEATRGQPINGVQMIRRQTLNTISQLEPAVKENDSKWVTREDSPSSNPIASAKSRWAEFADRATTAKTPF